MRALTKVLTHVNHQLFPGVATTLMNEVIDTPGYGGDFMLSNRKERAACLLLAARVFSDAADDNLTSVAALSWLNTQIAQGDHDSDVAMLPLTDPDILMTGHINLEVGVNPRWPMDLESIGVAPLIITSKFTIAHRGANTVPVSNSAFYTVLSYQVVAVSTEKYADMLLTQQRTS